MKEETKLNKYQPTTAEKKLLEVLIDPQNLGKSITDICSLAEVSRNTYYDAMNKPEFKELISEVTLDILKGKVADIFNATYKFALTEKGHQDRKMLLSMLGYTTDKNTTELNGNLDNKITVVFDAGLDDE